MYIHIYGSMECGWLYWSIRTSLVSKDILHPPFPLVHPPVCTDQEAYMFPTTSMVSIWKRRFQYPCTCACAMCDCVCVRNAREYRVERSGRHIIRGNGGMRAARDARNYPQLSRAYVIHGTSSTLWRWLLARLLDESLREFKHDTWRCAIGLWSKLRYFITRWLRYATRCACKINDIFQSAGVSLVHASLSLPLSLSSSSAHGRSVGRMFLTYRRRSRHNHRSRIRRSINYPYETLDNASLLTIHFYYRSYYMTGSSTCGNLISTTWRRW